MHAPAAPATERRSWVEGLSRHLPILSWLPHYQRAWLWPDLIAGLTVVALLIPEGMAYAQIAGMPPQAAISEGYERAFGTILDSNITTLIAGLALLIFGSGPIRGFAVVHCLGILTSIFSSVVVSRSLVNLIYGRQRKLTKVAIGQVWKPGAVAVNGQK